MTLRLRPKSISFLIYQATAINQKHDEFVVFHSFEVVRKTTKNHLRNINRSCCIPILSKS